MSTTITLSEWSKVGPADSAPLKGATLDSVRIPEDIVERLGRCNMLRLTELRSGLEIETTSYVGRVRLGDLAVVVRPKLDGIPLLRLLRYAFGLRRLELFSLTEHAVADLSFEDLLIHQLLAEVQEILSRGIHRTYVPRDERLSSPRGRIDVRQVIRDGGVRCATLPCRHHPRIEDTLLNRTLKAGLQVARQIASTVELQRECHRLESLLEESVSSVRLSASLLARAELGMSRLTTAYGAGLSIIRLLFEGQGILLEGDASSHQLPGFLFDMNAFFEALLGRFLRENLAQYEVVDQRGLKGMLRYQPQHNPRRRGTPTPRPDFAIERQNRVLAILDAKYRDLWERELPREMLYQLIVYAVSQPETPESTILFPAIDPAAREAKIDVTDPLRGAPLGRVCLRPVSLQHLDDLIRRETAPSARVEYAERLAFGAAVPKALPCQPPTKPAPVTAQSYRGRMTDSLGLDDPEFTFEITDALVTARRIRMRWIENGSQAALEAESNDAVHYSGSISYPRPMGNYRIILTRAVGNDGVVILVGHYESEEFKTKESCLFQLVPY